MPLPCTWLRCVVRLVAVSTSLLAIGSCASRPAAPPTAEADDDMVAIPGGTFLMGSNDGYPEERPAREVTVASFRIDRTEVTNRQFAALVAATGYITLAERAPDPKDYPDADQALLLPGSAVFVPPTVNESAADLTWWRYIPGACWKHPEGPESTIEDRMDYSVVHIAFEDAQACAECAGKCLPTEAEWEFAARGGLVNKTYAWGNEFTQEGRQMANTWQGSFPSENTRDDGFAGAAPVAQFPPNGFGLYDVAGNVWEWTTTEADGIARITKGGSFLCAPNHCQRYRPAARSLVTVDTGTSHIGFRCVRSDATPDPGMPPAVPAQSKPPESTSAASCRSGSAMPRSRDGSSEAR